MALSPEYLQGLPEELENLAMQLEADIIADISRRIAKAGAITDTAEYQMMILKEMGASTEYLEKLIAEYTGQSEEAVRELVFDAAQTDSDFYEAVYSRANRPYTPFEYNEYLQQLAVAAVNQTCGELNNFTRTMGFSVRGADGSIRFTSAADTYRSCMDKAFTLAAFGGADYETAVRTATKEMTASGLQFVDYASGVRNHADVAVRRALLTGVSQMTGQISLHNARDLDTDIVEVSAHAGARPDHAEWQGLWYSISGRDKRYPQLEEATGYGTVTGLKGANCRHDFYPVIPGISERTYSDEDLRNIDPPPITIDGKTYTYYEAEQRQRAIERAIRKTKREIIAAEASGDKDMFTAKSVLLRRQKEAYAEFSKKAGLLPRIERTGVAEYGRSISTKAVWADRKAGMSESANYFLKGKNSINGLRFDKIVGEGEISKALKAELTDEYARCSEMLGGSTTVSAVQTVNYRNDGIFGGFNPNNDIITLYGIGGDKGKDFMRISAKEHKATGDWSTKSYMHSFRHEIGHAWQKQLKKTDPNYAEKIEKIQKLKNDFWNNLTSSPDYDTMDLKKEQGKILSVYGLSKKYDIGELISEAVAEYLTGKPRPFAQNVIDIITGKE